MELQGSRCKSMCVKIGWSRIKAGLVYRLSRKGPGRKQRLGPLFEGIQYIYIIIYVHYKSIS